MFIIIIYLFHLRMIIINYFIYSINFDNYLYIYFIHFDNNYFASRLMFMNKRCRMARKMVVWDSYSRIKVVYGRHIDGRLPWTGEVEGGGRPFADLCRDLTSLVTCNGCWWDWLGFLNLSLGTSKFLN